MTMNAAQYAALMTDSRNYLFDQIRAALPPETEMEKRFIQSGVVSINEWAASLVNAETKRVRILVMLITNLRTSDEAKMAGAKSFDPQMKVSFELYHDHLQGTDGDNSQSAFEADVFALQFALETNRSLEPKGRIDDYDISLGTLASNRSLHFAKGEATIKFRQIRY